MVNVCKCKHFNCVTLCPRPEAYKKKISVNIFLSTVCPTFVRIWCRTKKSENVYIFAHILERPVADNISSENSLFIAYHAKQHVSETCMCAGWPSSLFTSVAHQPCALRPLLFISWPYKALYLFHYLVTCLHFLFLHGF